MSFRNLQGKTFVLGVGAQKAGTTWLVDYLRSHGDFVMSPLKEMHYFDQKLRPDLCAEFARAFETMLRNAIAKLKGPGDVEGLMEVSHLLDRVRMNHDERAYFEYFDRLATIDRSHVGEITPSYSLIRADGFRHIRTLFEQHGVALRIVFLMRDPVRRLASQLAMESREQGRPDNADAFRRALFDARHVERTRYDLTVDALTAAFEPDRLHFEFYESLFEERAIAALCRFLGVGMRPANFAARINAGGGGRTLGPDEYAMALECFRPVYEYCRRQFGERVPASWGKPADNADRPPPDE